MKDTLIIIRRNVVSPIVVAIFVLATTLLILGERRDAWFISVVITVNTLLAIVQEIRARRALKKLELMSAPRARRLNTDGTIAEVMFDQLKFDDVIRLQAGDEIPADAEILASRGLEANESMLTGESAAIDKPKGYIVYAGSAVVAGTADARVTAVGGDTKAGTMTATLRRYTPQLTPLQVAINRAISLLTYGALALAVLIFVVYYASGQDAVRIFKTITSAAVTIVPEGLLLASSLLLAFGSLKLAQAQVLPQKLAAIEAMALLNILCVDKTGTLTSDAITFDEFVPASRLTQTETERYHGLIGILARETSSDNATGTALIQAFATTDGYRPLDILAFSSVRKLSAIRVEYASRMETIMMGAPEYVTTYAPLSDALGAKAREFTRQGKRVLALATIDDDTTALKKLGDHSGRIVGLIVLTNPLREGVTKAVAYLQGQGVSVRVISGDNLDTVQYIAAAAGIARTERVMTGSELATLDDSAWQKTVQSTTIFARVLPEQKERIIATLRADESFIGMVGDGVNDALALKSADLGVAMFAGAAASRRVADIVLLDNSFTSLPMGMQLGNRIMQAIELISVLFFHKIIYGVTLLLVTLAVGKTYPFEPRHVTFLNIFLVTLPTVMWAFFPPNPQHRINPRNYWLDTLRPVIPIAFISGSVVTVFYLLASHIRPHDHSGVATSTVLVATFFGIWMVFLASRMLGVVYDRVTRLARGVYLAAVAVIALISFGSATVRDFFDFSRPTWSFFIPALLAMAAAATLQYQLARRAGDRFRASK